MYQTPIRKTGETHVFDLGGHGKVHITAYEKYKIRGCPRVYLAREILEVSRTTKTINLPGFIRSYALKAPISRREGIEVVDRRYSFEDDIMFEYVCYDLLDRMFLGPTAAAALLHYANEDIVNGLLDSPQVVPTSSLKGQPDDESNE